MLLHWLGRRCIVLDRGWLWDPWLGAVLRLRLGRWPIARLLGRAVGWLGRRSIGGLWSRSIALFGRRRPRLVGLFGRRSIAWLWLISGLGWWRWLVGWLGWRRGLISRLGWWWRLVCRLGGWWRLIRRLCGWWRFVGRLGWWRWLVSWPLGGRSWLAVRWLLLVALLGWLLVLGGPRGVDHVDGRGVVRLVDQHRQLMVGEGHILDRGGRVVAAPISTSAVRVGRLQIKTLSRS